jgi:hypothetical protein
MILIQQIFLCVFKAFEDNYKRAGRKHVSMGKKVGLGVRIGNLTLIFMSSMTLREIF